MNVIAWNCRGAAKPSFLDNFHDLVQKHKLDLFCLLETRVSWDSLSRLQRSLGQQWQFFTISADESLSGGIIIAWQRNLHHIQFYSNNRQIAFGSVTIPSMRPSIIAVVYASMGSYYKQHVNGLTGNGDWGFQYLKSVQ